MRNSALRSGPAVAAAQCPLSTPLGDAIPVPALTRLAYCWRRLRTSAGTQHWQGTPTPKRLHAAEWA